jgi:hypothetical protein
MLRQKIPELSRFTVSSIFNSLSRSKNFPKLWKTNFSYILVVSRLKYDKPIFSLFQRLEKNFQHIGERNGQTLHWDQNHQMVLTVKNWLKPV